MLKKEVKMIRSMRTGNNMEKINFYMDPEKERKVIASIQNRQHYRDPLTKRGETFREMIHGTYTADLYHYRRPFFFRQIRLGMEYADMSAEKLAEQAGVSVKTVFRMCNDPERLYRIGEVCAVILALRLSYDQALSVIQNSTAGLPATEWGCAYHYLLTQAAFLTVAEINQLLYEAGYPPMTDLIGDES